MPDIEDARELYNGLPDVDPTDPSGEDAAVAADDQHGEVDEIADDAEANTGNG